MPLTIEAIREIVEATVPKLIDERVTEFEGRLAKEGPAKAGAWREQFLPEDPSVKQYPLARKVGGDQHEGKGLDFARVIRCFAAAKGDIEQAAHIAAEQFGPESRVVRALAAGEGAAGGFLVDSELSDEIIELLRPMTVVRSLNPIVLPMESGVLEVRKLAGGASASYSGENEDIGVSEPTFELLRLTWKKLTAIVPFSNDLLRFASPTADVVVRDDLVASLATREDVAFIRGDGLGDTPKGLRNWAPSTLAATGGVSSLDNTTNDLGRLVLHLEEANVRMIRPAWIMSPRTKQYLMTVRDSNGNYAYRPEMLLGQLWTWPFRTTTQIPVTLGAGTDESELYLVDFADAVIGEATGLTIDASSDASYVEAGSLRSTFSRDQTAIRAIAQHDFGMRHDASIAVLTAVQWTP